VAELTITHSPEDGTQLHGSAKGDGVLEIVRGHHFLWKRGRGIHVPASRDTIANLDHLDRVADALRAAGHAVTVEVDNRWRPMEEREADRAERAESRADWLDERAGKAAARSEAAQAASDRISDHIPFGQPILVGHHSEGRARRDAERIHAGMRKAIDEADYADDLARRSNAAAAHMAHREDPRVTMRRIEKLEAEGREWQRRLADATPGSNRAEYCRLNSEQNADEIRYWRAHLAAHADAGTFVAWGPEHFRKGDYVRLRGSWLPVRRVNRKSVSVPGGYGMAGADASWSDTVPWDDISGRRRDGEQLDKPDGEPWPVELARKVERWTYLAHVGSLREHEYDDTGRHVRWAMRLVHGLDLGAGEQEVAACQPDKDDVTAWRELAAAYLAVHERLAAGESVPDIKATLTLWDGSSPLWRMPDGEPDVIRVDEARAGDLVKGFYERGSFGPSKTLKRWFCGPVERVIPHRGDEYSGERFVGWWTVRLVGGREQRFKRYDTLAVFRADVTAEAPAAAAAVKVLEALAADLARAGEDVHAGNAARMAGHVRAGAIVVEDVPGLLRGMRCPQHIRPRIEQAADAAADATPEAPEHPADAYTQQRADMAAMVQELAEDAMWQRIKQAAEAAGRKAYELGRPRAPWADETVSGMVEGLAVGEGSAELFKAFTRGFDAAADEAAQRALADPADSEDDPWALVLKAAGVER
jgi:hypothetical protein